MNSRFQKFFMSLAFMVFATPALVLGAANTDMENLDEKVKADKKHLVEINMSLTKEEANDFWPLYDAYQKELQSTNQEIGQLFVKFAKAYAKGPLPNETAKQILDDVLALEAKEVQAKRSYADKMANVLPASKVTRYMQIESKIRALVKFELAQLIPLSY